MPFLALKVATPYGGWEAPSSELRGHFVGHYLSAAASAAASSGDEQIARNLASLLNILEACQREDGYLSAYPDSLLDRFERHEQVWAKKSSSRMSTLSRSNNTHPMSPHEQVWAPFYSLHKILAGLVDAWRFGGSPIAKTMAHKLAGYIASRAEAVVSARGIEHWRSALNAEFGGLAEALRAVGDATGERERFEAAAQARKVFTNDFLWGRGGFHFCSAISLLTRDRSASCGTSPASLDRWPRGRTRWKGCTQTRTSLCVPTPCFPFIFPLTLKPLCQAIPGAVARFAATGEAAFLAAAVRFFDLVNDTRNYATGGSSHGELWHAHDSLASTLGDAAHGGSIHAEQCVTHNALKTATWLLRARKGARHRAAYADFLERATLNGLLGAQRGPGEYLYMYPLGAGVSKAAKSQWREAGWSRPFDDFWCCCGTMVESFSRLNDGIFFASDGGDGVPALTIAQLTSSVALWGGGGYRVTVRFVIVFTVVLTRCRSTCISWMRRTRGGQPLRPTRRSS